MAMILYLTKQQYLRWCEHRKLMRDHSLSHKGISSWICENRDPHDVKTIILSICRYGYSVFYYRHIRKFFTRVNGTKPVSRASGVNALHALWKDGFIDIEKRKDGNRSRYTRLFPVDDWEQVYSKVVNK